VANFKDFTRDAFCIRKFRLLGILFMLALWPGMPAMSDEGPNGSWKSGGSHYFHHVVTQPPVVAAPPVSASGGEALLTDFGPAGQGNDDTSILEAALLNTAGKKTLRIPAGTYLAGPFNVPSNTALVLDPGVTVNITSNISEQQKFINIVNVSNVSITGAQGQSAFVMRKPEYNSGEYRHCLDIEGASDVTVNGISCNNSGGDGVYIGGGSRGYSSNIVLKNSTFDNNRRQGMSVISVNGLQVQNCTFSNTNGTAPAAGIDMEPNVPADRLQNVTIQNSTASGNQGNGFMISIPFSNSSTPPVSVVVDGFTSRNNGRSGYVAINEHDDGSPGPQGTVDIRNSTSTDDSEYGFAASFWDAGGPKLTFSHMKVVDANASRSDYDNAAIAVKRGGGDKSVMGNVTITGASIQDTKGYLDHYFTVEEYSNAGLAGIRIGNFAGLSSTKNIPIGVLNGKSVDSVNIP
jgi:hypothetical protein